MATSPTINNLCQDKVSDHESQPMHNTEQLLAYMDDNKIEHETIQHAPVFTVEESQVLRDTLPAGSPAGPGGAHVKNLFLKNKKNQLVLVTMLDENRLDIKALGQNLGLARLSFASPERLMQHLGVTPGSVTPLALINDPKREVDFYLDDAILTYDRLHLHPLVNHMTSMVKPEQLRQFIESLGRELKTLTFESKGV